MTGDGLSTKTIPLPTFRSYGTATGCYSRMTAGCSCRHRDAAAARAADSISLLKDTETDAQEGTTEMDDDFDVCDDCGQLQDCNGCDWLEAKPRCCGCCDSGSAVMPG
jgi:hypothetical protein